MNHPMSLPNELNLRQPQRFSKRDMVGLFVKGAHLLVPLKDRRKEPKPPFWGYDFFSQPETGNLEIFIFSKNHRFGYPQTYPKIILQSSSAKNIIEKSSSPSSFVPPPHRFYSLLSLPFSISLFLFPFSISLLWFLFLVLSRSLFPVLFLLSLSLFLFLSFHFFPRPRPFPFSPLSSFFFLLPSSFFIL